MCAPAPLLPRPLPCVPLTLPFARLLTQVTELAWADALKGEPLIDEMIETNQAAYNHYAGSGKKKLSYSTVCSAFGEDEHELISTHGIRWRESTFRGSRNLLLSWRARVTDLQEEASVEIGLKLTPLSPPESFLQHTFLKRTTDANYGAGEKTFVLKVDTYLGKQHTMDKFRCKYMRVLNGRTCMGELEDFTKGDLLTYLHADNKKRLEATDAGKLMARLTPYQYVKTLAFWVDATSEGKIMSKLFQSSGVLLSDVMSGVEDAVDAIKALNATNGMYMAAIAKDYDTANETLYGHELADVANGQTAYVQMLTNVTSSIASHLTNRFAAILKDPVLKAACIFEHGRWPSVATAEDALKSYGEVEINLLLSHFKTLYEYLGGDPAKVSREWRRLKLFVSRDPNLSAMSYKELYERLFDQYSTKKSNEQHY